MYLFITPEATSIFFFVLCGILLALILIGWVSYMAISISQRRTRHMRVDLPIKASELARANLDKAGLTEVKVKTSTMRSGYNKRLNAILITRRMERKLTAFSVAKVMQAVALAVNYNLGVYKGKKSGSVVNGLSTWFLIILTIVSIFVEILSTSNSIKWIVFIIFALAIALYVFSIFYSSKSKSTLAKANDTALGFIENLAIFEEKDIAKIKKFYDCDIKKITIKRTISILIVFYYILKIISILFNKK